MTAAASPTVPLVRDQVRGLLLRSPAYWALDEPQRRELAYEMVNVGQYLADAGGQTAGVPLGVVTTDDAARDFGQDAVRALAGDDGPPDTAGADFAGQGGAVAAVAGTEALANLVSSIDFPAFVSGLIQGVFQAIVDSSIQQMEAFADLVKNVSKSVDEYMKDNVSPNQARDYLAERYPDHLQVDLSAQTPQVVPKPDADESALPDFFKDLGLAMPVESMDQETPEQVLMPAARQQMAIDRQRMLLMMVVMGMNRLKVVRGSVRAAVIFQLNTKDSITRSRARASAVERTTKNRGQNGMFSGWFSPTWEETSTGKFNVTTTQTDDSAATASLKASLTGDVSVEFASETFPLADMTSLLGLQEPALPTSQPRPPATGSETA